MSKRISAFSIAGIYIGTLIGAGFASGQEILQFFVFFGIWGIVGIIIATGLFILFGYLIMEFAYDLKAESHLVVIRKVSGPLIGRLVDAVITFFLFAGFVVMIAGAGAIFKEQLGLFSLLGSALMIVISILTILMGVTGIINSMRFLVPILVIAVISVSMITLLNDPISLNEIQYSNDVFGVVDNWLLSSILYVSYNIVIGVAVLAPLGKLFKGKDNILKGAVIGGFGLGMSALIIQLALLSNLPEAAEYEIPMVYLAGNISPLFNIGYIIMLLIGIYTTAIGSLFGFLTRVVGMDNPKLRTYVGAIGIFSLFASQLGFSTLVKIIYPAVGYAGLILLISLAFAKLKQIFS